MVTILGGEMYGSENSSSKEGWNKNGNYSKAFQNKEGGISLGN